MKLTIGPLDKTYKLCTSTGRIKEKSVDVELIKSLKFELHINALRNGVEKKLN